MRPKYVLAAMATVLAAVVIGAVACGDGDDGDGNGGPEPQIRTESGLSLTNIDAFSRGFSAGEESADDGDAGAPGALPPETGGDLAGSGAVIDRGFAPYPMFQQVAGGTGITVQGYGTATMDADSARIELYFSKYTEGFSEPVPDTRSSDGGGSEPAPDTSVQEIGPISEEDLQPVIDALVAAGVDRDDIEFVGQGYYDPYYASATLRATVGDIDSVESVAAAAREAAAGLSNVELNSTNIAYSVSDCSALESAALQAAIEDAGGNADTFAAALGVTAGEIIGATNYSYYPYEGTACDSYWGYYPLYEDVAFAAGPAEVTVYAQVAVTYAIQ